MGTRTPPREQTHTVIDSPVGPLTLVADEAGITGVYMTAHRHMPEPATFGDRVPGGGHLDAAADQLARYFDGTLTGFDVPLSLHGTPFQRSVWEQLRGIPHGETISYGELARRLGNPAASRAVGLANGRNPVSIIVPCHRVIGAGGDLTGYGGGLANKRRLLDFERGTALF